MRKIVALCCLLGILLLSACTPKTQQTDSTTAPSDTTTTTTTTTDDTTVSTDDTAWSDTDWSDDFSSTDDTDAPDPDDDPVSDADPVYKEVIPTGNTSTLLNPQKGGADAEAEALRQKVLNAANTSYDIKGTTYYVSPNGDDNNAGTSPETAWQTIDAVITNSFLMEEGDAVLFERGGIYRRTSPITVQSGITYGAYGEGAKPAIYGSATNYAWGSLWEPSRKENVWKVTLYSDEAGMVIFNHGEEVGDRKMHGVNELTENGDFFHNVDNSTLYLYLDKGYPNVVYKDIEIGTKERVFNAPEGTTDVVIDNITIKYSGVYAISTMGDAKNFTISNCEIGWIGGCRYKEDSDTRLGNGIQFWENTENALVENCWVYQVYDAGISPQGVAGSTYKDIVIRDTLIEYCTYNFEFFDRVNTHVWDGLVLEDNIFRFAGLSWAGSRPDTYAVSLICGWNISQTLPSGKGIAIKNNIFDVSNANLIYWPATKGATLPPIDTLVVSGNSFYQKANATKAAVTFSNHETVKATNQAEFEASVRGFDSNPKLIKWLS